MSVVVSAPRTPADPPASPERPAAMPRAWRWHVFVLVAGLGLAIFVTQGLWQDPARHVIADNAGDQAFFEWLLGYGVHTLGHGADPFFTNLLNAPVGVNLAANTSITVYTTLFAPLTKLAGPQVSFVTILTLNLAGSAYAWFLFLRRWVVRRPAAAALGGMFCGFAPGFISHANGHLNWTAGWVAPVVLWWVLKLREPGRWLRNGVVLGALLAVGFSIAAEGLFFTALASGVFLITWSCAPATRAEARTAAPTVLAALGITAVVAAALLAYPLFMHFAGPQSFSGTGFNQRRYVEDVASYFSYPSRSLAGWAGFGSDLAPNPTEETSFFGVPLMVLTVVALVALWRRAEPGRRATLRALAVVGAVFMVLSWGPRLNFNGQETGTPLPYAALAQLPLFDSALPARLALVLAGIIGIVLALLADQVLTTPQTARSRTTWTAAAALALVPLIPMPLLVTTRSAEPRFIADGTWKQYVPDGGVLTALPFALNVAADGQRWQAYTMARGGAQFRIPDGYFLGPGGPNETGRIGALPRRTDYIFQAAAFWGYVTPVDDFDRAQARNDLAYWGVDAVFLADQVTGAKGPLSRSALERVATALLGPPEHAGDVLVWRIRPGVDPVIPAE